MSKYDISYTPDSSRVQFMMTRLNQPFYIDAATADKFTVMSAEQPEVFKDLMNNIETEKFRQTSKICEAATLEKNTLLQKARYFNHKPEK